MALTPAIFLDKDGTVLEDVPYNVDPEKMVLAPGAAQGLQRLSKLGVPLLVVSNQPGVALDKFDLPALQTMQARLHTLFLDVGATLGGFYYCPHHAEGTVDAYRRRCLCRKPAPGLLLSAAVQQDVDLSRSWMIGDILHDVEAGRRAGCTTVLIDNGNETEWVMDTPWRHPHHRVPDLEAASRIIVSQFRQHEAAA